MPKNRLPLAVAALLFCAGACSLCAASLRYRVEKNWTTDDGLPQSSVLALVQTRDGYLWLGTGEGLARFDGLHFTRFNEGNTPELKSNKILKLFEDSQGNLWIGTEAGVVFVDQQGHLRRIEELGRGGRGTNLKAICEDRHGAVWLYTANGQLARYYGKAGDIWNVGSDRYSIRRDLAFEDSGILWVGTDNTLHGIGPTPPATGVGLAVAQELPVTKLDFLLASKNGGYWRFADGRIGQWRTNHLERDLGPYPWPGQPFIAAAIEDPEGNLVVGTYGEGLYWFDHEGKATVVSGLNTNFISALTMDREGCLWVGTDGRGLFRVRRQVFEILEGSLGSTPQSVCEDPLGGLWVGYNSERVDHLTDSGVQRLAVQRPARSLAVRAVLVDQEHATWVGAFGGGLFKLQNDAFQPVPGFDLMPNSDVSAIYQDQRGVLWIGTQGGLVRWRGETGICYTNAGGPAVNAVRAMAEDRSGNFWIGTEGGLLRLGRAQSGSTWFNHTNGLPSDNVSSLDCDEQGILWVGTSRGLARFFRDQWTPFTNFDRLANSIGYLLDDGQGHLWIGSYGGLMRVAKTALNDFAEGKPVVVPIRVYGKADGLPLGECTQGSQPGPCRTKDGTLWFPTSDGLASVDPSQMWSNTNPPPVVIETVLLDGQLVTSNTLRAPLPHEIQVPARKQSLEIKYTSLNIAAPTKGRFRYRLDRHEESWVYESGDIRTARYTKLPPGHYRFYVSACNEDEVWNSTECTLAIRVLPPFWRTWWFLGASSLVLLALLVGSVHYASTQRLQRQLAALRQQEALEQERARIARDLHDQLGANLTQVALLSEMAETDKDLPQEVEAHARQIAQTARETTRALDEIVWTVNPANDTLDGLINYVCKYAQEFLATAGLSYRLEVPPTLPNTPISPEFRHHLFLVAKEAVNNVVKHSHASSAWLRLRFEPGQFILEIEDNGAGLSPQAEDKGRSGLSNMRQRMQEIGGSFDIRRGPQGGTLVSLKVPVHEHSATS